MAKSLAVYGFLCLAILLFARNTEAINKNVARIYELKRGNLSFKFTNLGASMLSAIVPDKNGLPSFFPLLQSTNLQFFSVFLFDINYVLKDISHGRHFKKAAVVKESVSGRKLEVWTNQKGLQFYTGNMLNKVKGIDGCVYSKQAGFTLETRGFPDAVNHREFPNQFVRRGKIYHHFMVFRFTA